MSFEGSVRLNSETKDSASLELFTETILDNSGARLQSEPNYVMTSKIQSINQDPITQNVTKAKSTKIQSKPNPKTDPSPTPEE